MLGLFKREIAFVLRLGFGESLFDGLHVSQEILLSFRDSHLDFLSLAVLRILELGLVFGDRGAVASLELFNELCMRTFNVCHLRSPLLGDFSFLGGKRRIQGERRSLLQCFDFRLERLRFHLHGSFFGHQRVHQRAHLGRLARC